MEDLRWQQRLENFHSALMQLSAAVNLADQRSLSDLEKQGLIQAFEYTHEIAWNVLRDYFIYQGNNAISGSRDATREAFQKGLIDDGEVWIEMIKSRNHSSHTYNMSIAEVIFEKIVRNYEPAFKSLLIKMRSLKI